MTSQRGKRGRRGESGGGRSGSTAAAPKKKKKKKNPHNETKYAPIASQPQLLLHWVVCLCSVDSTGQWDYTFQPYLQALHHCISHKCSLGWSIDSSDRKMEPILLCTIVPEWRRLTFSLIRFSFPSSSSWTPYILLLLLLLFMCIIPLHHLFDSYSKLIDRVYRKYPGWCRHVCFH